jgi:hypothetical protein
MTKERWEQYCATHLTAITPILLDLGFSLESEQPHLAGERYLLSGPKLVLYGERVQDQLPVIIKVTDDTQAARELLHERDCRKTLTQINFAYQLFHSPTDILFAHHNKYTISITQYIPQDTPFLDRTLEEQFFLTLKALESQEASHATTAEHIRAVARTFEVYTGTRYHHSFVSYQTNVHTSSAPKHTKKVFEDASTVLHDNTTLLDRYAGFLTHWDFVPHNIRVHTDTIYLLDHTAIRFGNKYEGWARCMNFMTLYHRALETALDTYVRSNRRAEEYETLRLMRIYRLGELIWFYVTKREQAEGTLRTLTDARITLWTQALEAQLSYTPLSESVLDEYRSIRDTLRDPEEKKRQQGLH